MVSVKFFYLLLATVTLEAARSHSFYDYDSNEDDPVMERCENSRCKLPNCSCFGTKPPGDLDHKDAPQFVMLTFDDAINVQNIETYRVILKNRKNKGNGCPIAMTFFVCHEYNDYSLTNELYQMGNEIAVHSITHESNTMTWKTADKERWKQEMVGMRRILSKFGEIPENSIRGHRAPFLQTAGSTTFQMLRDYNFSYDSSLPSRNYMDPPIWPYTLDFGYPQDCQISPCPKGSFPGLWEFPMVQFLRKFKTEKGYSSFHCSMADACTPYPETAKDTKDYLMANFYRHYNSSKSPFPLFLHEAWLRSKDRLQGYIQFLDEILQKDDVFVVSMSEVLEFMSQPTKVEDYKSKKCFKDSRPAAGGCSAPNNCNFPVRNRFMKSCIPCPKRYPWLGNPYGQAKKKTKD